MLEYIIIALLVVLIVLAVLILTKSNSNADEALVVIREQLKGIQEELRIVKEDNIRYSASIRQILDTQQTGLYRNMDALAEQVKSLSEAMDRLRAELGASMQALRDNNAKSLESIRSTVDEKLTESIDTRLANSFKVISDTLEAVTKGVGEMQSLATGVDGLKNLLTNVKTRGGWGEVTLENLLQDVMTPEQYYRQYKIKPNSNDMVDYAIIMPGKEDSEVLLPIDAKFPMEDYQRLIDASQRGDRAMVEESVKALRRRIIEEAKTIQSKYIAPPTTIDFAIMFLPTEGLFAEVMRIAGLSEEVQNKYRVILAGPTTISALLNSLQMGFRTVAVEKRTSEISKLLATFKKDFQSFNSLLVKTHKKLTEATSTIEKATDRTRIIGKRLSKVEIDGEDEPLELEDIQYLDTPDE
ncbi:MAG: DNA recombination protein RmuC [Clostridia bacterium]|nr:DNA recombination protein RmuC [Clostridia bacterium]